MSTHNIGIGIGALTTNTGNDNIAIGRDALKNIISGDYNIGIGSESGSSQNTAIFNFNTYIGYNTSIEANPLTSNQGANPAIENSTAIGKGSKIFEANQIVLGTASDYVYIPKQMSIGKVGVSNQISRKPATDVGLDVSGSLLVSGNITGNNITGNNITGNNITCNNMIMNDVSANTLFLDTRLVTDGDISGNGDLFIGGNIYKNGVEINSNNFAADQVKALYSDDYKNTYVGSNTTLLGGSGYQGLERSTTIGYGANIDVSNQIVLGTSGEFVCIPSNRGLSIGKKTAPTSGYALDVSGQMMINNGIFAYDDLGYNTSLFSIIPNPYPGASGYLGYQVKTSYNTNVNNDPFTSNNFGNTAIGAASLNRNTTGSGNTAIGARSLYNNTSGFYNTSIGGDNLFQNISGNLNISLGVGALYNHVTGSFNTAIGNNAGETDVSGSNNTFLGSRSNVTNNSSIINNSTAIGSNATIDVSNQIVIGTSGEFVCIPSNRGLSIGKKTAPTSGYALDVSGSINFSGDIYKNGQLFVSGSGSGSSNSITGDLSVSGDISGNGDLFITGSVEASSYNATSDYRIKDNVRNLDDGDTISNLRPVKYMNKLSNKNDFGLIAHELQLEYPDLVSGIKDGTEYQSVNYTGLISILIKEIQDLKRLTSNQTIQLESQATQLERINKQLYPND